MPLKKPVDLFDRDESAPKEPSIGLNGNVPNIKEEFDKVEDLREQLNNVSSSLNSSLTEVVNKNLNFLSNEYSDQIGKFNNKINKFREEIVHKVNNLKKSNSDLKADIEIVEQRQNKINITAITEEVLSEVQDVLSGNLEENIKRLEDKIEIIKEAYEENILKEGLLNEPPSTDNEDPLTPLDKNYATIDDLNNHYQLFLNRIQQQLSTLGGGGAVNIKDMDDVDSSAFVNGKVLEYDSTLKKWKGGTGGGGGGSGIGTENVRTNTLEVVGVTTFTDDVQFVGANTNARWDKSKSDLVLYDNTRLTLGSNEDFQMWHGGTNTFIKNTGGDLRIRSNDLRLQKEDGSESYLRGNTNAEVTLFYNGNEKFATLGTGVTVTGVCYATSFSGDGSALTGVSAAKGEKGAVGPGGGDKGQKGEAGVKGQKGEVGSTGSSGSNGSAGAKGQKGEVGSTGSSGSNGSAGSKGQKGEVGTGSAGDKGQKGAAGSGGSGSFTRTTANASTSSIANNASSNITITAAKTYALQKIQTSAAAWVTLYTDTTSRSNDSSRNETTDPTPGSGVIAEAITAGSATQLVTPGLIGFNNDGTPSTNVYLKVVNKSGSTQAITITLHYLPLET